MKILLINPPVENPVIEYPSEDGSEYIEPDDFGYFPPLGALYVLSYLKKNTAGHDLFFRDCVAERISHKDLKRIVKEISPDIVGVTTFTALLVDISLVTAMIKSILPDVHICLGGHHATAFPSEALQLPGVDSIIVGEGEFAFTDLVKCLEKGGDINSITNDGIYTAKTIAERKQKPFKDERFLRSICVPPAYIDDLDVIPPPDRNFIKHINYHSIVGVTSKLATIITSRGCPYKCSFCDVPMKAYRKRSPALVLDEIQECLSMGYEEFHFYDDLFNITPARVMEICDEIDKRKLKFKWDFRGRVNTVTRESLERAKRSGCRMISFGVETGSDEGLRYLNKGTTIAQIIQVFKWCRELKIRTIADFMIGLPFEKTAKDIMKDIDFLIGLDPDYAQFAILSLYPNTAVYAAAIEKGLIDPERWRDFSLKPYKGFKVDHWEEFMTTQELVELQRRSYLKFYMRPKYICRQILAVRTAYEFKAKVKGVLKLFNIK